jgi:hypothetical protein
MKKLEFLYILVLILVGACNSNSHTNEDLTADSALSEEQSAANRDISPGNNQQQEAGGSVQGIEENSEAAVRLGFEQAAKAFMESYRDGRFTEFVRYMHPAVVKAYGGPVPFIAQLKQTKNQDPQRYRKWETGQLEAFTAVRDDRGRVTGWYSVVPIKRWLEGAPDGEYQLQWLGGQSLDAKQFHFVDITDGDKGMIYRIMPDMRYLLESLDTKGIPKS